MRTLRDETIDGERAVLLSPDLLAELGFRDGDEIETVAAQSTSPEDARSDESRAAVARMAEERLKRPDGFRFDRDEANER